MPRVLLTVVSNSTGIAVSRTARCRRAVCVVRSVRAVFRTRYEHRTYGPAHGPAHGPARGRRIVSAPCRENALHAIARVVVAGAGPPVS